MSVVHKQSQKHSQRGASVHDHGVPSAQAGVDAGPSTACSSEATALPKRSGPDISCGCHHCACDEHDHGHDHVHGHGKEEDTNKTLVIIFGSLALLILGLVLKALNVSAVVTVLIFAAAYMLGGHTVLLTAARNIRNGDVFDENFLMSLASLGAFALGEYPEAVAVMLFYRVGEYFEDRAVERSRSRIMEVVDMRPETVNVLEGFHAEHASYDAHPLPSMQARVGDYVLIRPGERIPLDATIVEGTSRVDTSPVTGEPVPVSVEPGSQLVSGCVNMTGQLVARVDKVLEESMVTRILDAVEHAAARKPQIERFITRFARVYTPAVVIIAAATFVLGALLTGDVAKWLYAACTFLVISCPCAMVISIPLAFYAGIGAASKQGILVKGGHSLEALHKVRAVLMDKTGTLTQGTFEVQQISPVTGLTPAQVLAYAAGCEAASTHPIAQSIVSAAQRDQIALRSRDEVVEHAGKGLVARVYRDADHGEEHVDIVACGNEQLMELQGVTLPPSLRINDGVTHVLVAVNGQYVGAIEIADAVKDDAIAATKQLHQQHIHTVMLTGDTSATARAVATATGVDEVHAQLLPEDKVTLLEQVRSQQGPVLFVGDGINDAPVLAAADVGAAMGSGSDAALEAADVVYMTSNVSAVPASIALGHRVHRVAVQNIVLALSVKLGVMLLGFLGCASMWAAVFADVGVALLCILNAIRLLRS